MWIILVILSFKSFSQTDIVAETITLTPQQAREVIKDILEGDAAKIQVNLQNQIIKQKDSIITVKDTIIQSQKFKIDLAKNALDSFDDLNQEQKNSINSLEKSLKQSERRRKFFKTGFVITGIVAGTLLLVN